MAEIVVGREYKTHKYRILVGASEGGQAVEPQVVVDRLAKQYFLDNKESGPEEDVTAVLEMDWLKGDQETVDFLLGRSKRKLSLRKYIGLLFK